MKAPAAFRRRRSPASARERRILSRAPTAAASDSSTVALTGKSRAGRFHAARIDRQGAE
jgi:hypothetical protein